MWLKLNSEGDFTKLKKSLERLLPVSGQMLNILNMKIQGRLRADTQTEFHVYNGNEENGNDEWEDPFVLCVQCPNIHSPHCIIMKVPQTITPQMVEAFDNFVNWETIHLFSAVNQQFFEEHLRPLCVKHGGLTKRGELEEGHPCEAYAAMGPKQADLNLDSEEPNLNGNSAENIETKALSVNDSTELLRNYTKWELPHSKGQVELAIKNLASSGVYVDGVLASSALLSPVGLMNMLYTDKAFRRRGFGVEVLKYLGESIKEMRLIPMAECEIWNDASRTVLKRSGCTTFVGLTNWVLFK